MRKAIRALARTGGVVMINYHAAFLSEEFRVASETKNGYAISNLTQKEAGFCATLFQIARKSLILKRRDVRVVEGARLEIEARQR